MRFPGDDHKITNSDEQEVAVNASTTDEGGYDEPVSHSTLTASSESEGRKDTGDKEVEKKKTSQQPHHYKAT